MSAASYIETSSPLLSNLFPIYWLTVNGSLLPPELCLPSAVLYPVRMEGCLSSQKWMIYMLGVEAFPLFDGKWASERENRLLIGDLSPPCRFSLHPPSMTMHPICRPPSSFLPTRLDLERIRDCVDKDAVQVKTSASAVRCRCIHASSIARSTQASGTGRRRRVS